MNNLLKVLQNDGLVIMPTDTVYGLVGDALNENVIKKIYEIKKRDYQKPLLILVSDIEMLNEYIEDISYLEQEIINFFWPGPLTIIFKKNAKLSNLLTANKDTIAVRLPNDESLRNIIRTFGRPIIATSANIAGSATITNINELEEEMKSKVQLIIDGGTINKEPSTIIEVQNNKIVFLREEGLASKIKQKFNDKI